MEPFATLDDLSKLWRPLTAEERPRAEALLNVVSDMLRLEAFKVCQHLDNYHMPGVEEVAKSVTVDVVARALMTSTNHEPMTQMTQSAGGYSATGTFLVPGGGIFIKKSELARLGLRRQRFGMVNFHGCKHD